jgi:hypothetical protein
MVTAINFQDEHMLAAGKICEVAANGKLPHELV